MSFSCAKSLLGLSSRVLRQSAVSGKRSFLHSASRGPCRLIQNQRTLTRSMWYMCRAPESQSTNGVMTTEKVTGWTKTCGCCGLHTAGDKDLAEFLADEIKYEQKNETKAIPQVKGFEITKSDGTSIELTRKDGDETVVIKFNVNHTVDDESPMDYKEAADGGDNVEAQMVSRPPFLLEITKTSGQTLAVQCVFPVDKFAEEQQQGEYEDLLEIDEVALLENGQKWEDSSYILSGSNMDANLYDMLLNMMEERGITEDFINELVEFSTAYEHKQYLGFLQNLQGFVSCK